MGCGSCHTFTPAGARGDFGPPLDGIRLSAAAVRARIADPYPGSTGGMGMPEDYAQRMRPDELTALAEFVAATASG
jgi:mono/diheme cytochrome c family protein